MSIHIIFRHLITAALLIIAGAYAHAQELTWAVDFRNVFDNREGDHTYNETRTFFQTQLAPEIGVKIGKNRISAGAVWTQPIGSRWHGYTITPTLYYRYHAPRLRASLGFFPRSQLIEKMPEYLWSDSLNYAQHNIRGAMIQYAGHDGFFEAFIDWRGMQSRTEREAFSIQAHGTWHNPSKIFMVGGTAMMNHLAKTYQAPADQYIVDNFVANPWVGIDLSNHTPLDSLTLKAGPLASLTRYRLDNAWRLRGGAHIQLYASWRWLSLSNTLYLGKQLMPFYGQFQSILHLGEPFFAARRYYNRTVLAGTLIGNDFVNLQASLVFNAASNCFNFYQRLTLIFYIDSLTASNRRHHIPNPRLRNPY